MSDACPCGSGARYEACCARFHRQEAVPATAEELMRSRYSAFVKSAVDYLEATLHPDQRADFDLAATADWCHRTIWLGLEVNSRRQGGINDRTGNVTFTARFLVGTEVQVYRETSFFRRLDGRWYYVRALGSR